jgi:putative transposase
VLLSSSGFLFCGPIAWRFFAFLASAYSLTRSAAFVQKMNSGQELCEADAAGGCGQADMARVKRHSRVEVATKLAQANELARQGKLQSEIARTLGVSVMTLHRWRKEDEPNRRDDRIAELQLEISRLRRLVADLLVVKLEEAAQTPKSARGRRRA